MRPLSKEGFLALKPDLIFIAQVKPSLAYPAAIANGTPREKTRIITLNSQILEGMGADFASNLQSLVEQVYYAH